MESLAGEKDEVGQEQGGEGQQAINRENQGANKRTGRGKFVNPGNQMCFLKLC